MADKNVLEARNTISSVKRTDKNSPEKMDEIILRNIIERNTLRIRNGRTIH